MNPTRIIHPDFQYHLQHKTSDLIDLYLDLRNVILEIYPQSIELLYHTHALTSVYSVTEKLSDGFCMLPIYTNHLNLGFHKGTLLNDPHDLLQGTGKYIRHIPVTKKEDYRCSKVMDLITISIEFALDDSENEISELGRTLSKIKPAKN